jgi:hypothetical protein
MMNENALRRNLMTSAMLAAFSLSEVLGAAAAATVTSFFKRRRRAGLGMDMPLRQLLS